MKIFGSVKFFNVEKGFGFLARDDGHPDVFVGSRHIPDRLGQLHAGDRVAFDIGFRDDGKQFAENAERLDAGSRSGQDVWTHPGNL